MNSELRERALAMVLGLDSPQPEPAEPESTLIPLGSYVIVRCRDAGVHAGVLRARRGRTCELSESRRLWRWYPAKGAFLSAVASYGLKHQESKVGAPVTIALTEDCEIILCAPDAEQSIRSAPNSHE